MQLRPWLHTKFSERMRYPSHKEIQRSVRLIILSFLTQVFNVDFRAGRGSSASCAVAGCLYRAAMGLGYLALSGKIAPEIPVEGELAALNLIARKTVNLRNWQRLLCHLALPRRSRKREAGKH